MWCNCVNNYAIFLIFASRHCVFCSKCCVWSLSIVLMLWFRIVKLDKQKSEMMDSSLILALCRMSNF